MSGSFEFHPLRRLPAGGDGRPVAAATSIVWRPGYLMVLKKSARVRARPADAIRLARVRREGRSRIGEIVRVELNRDHSIFDLETDKVNGLTFGRHAVTDGKGRSWRYRDIVAAQARYLREEAERDRRGAGSGQAEADDAVFGVGGPERDPVAAGLNGGNAADHIVDCHDHPLANARIVRAGAPEPGAVLDLAKVTIKHVTGSPVKAVRA